MKDQTRESTRTRRQHEREFKDELVAQSLVPGASVAGIAMKGGINANLLFKWRREHVKAMAASAPTAATLLPVCVVPEAASPSTAQPTSPVGPAINPSSRPGVIEVEIAGAQLRLRGAVDEAMLGSVLRALRQSA
ncbi:transposase [Variovorax sp. WS11]|uniref:IS66-like element accessory protein TnpA n=1 Tax=Variovorax sp. WS11 TaxID=1105204 RepID=UPI0013DB82EC|nr:transposase [Variovorax sp. WS11]NDZ18972.1 transposase [Variovorax sp. WS11]